MMILFENIEIMIALVIAFILAVHVRSFLQRKRKLRKMADSLNLDFSEKPLDEQAESELAGMKDRAWVPWLQKVISLFSPWEIKGRFQGMPVRMWTRYRTYTGRTGTSRTRRKTKEAFMRMEICFHENLGLGLQIFSDNPFVKGGYDGYDDRRIELSSGNPELDRKVTINGISEERIGRLLRRTDILEALLQLFEKYSNAVVDDESVRLEEARMIVDADKCRERLDALILVASSIDRAIRFV